jgi:hypothetical protein
MRSVGLADNRGAHFQLTLLSGYLWVLIAGLLAIAVWETRKGVRALFLVPFP